MKSILDYSEEDKIKCPYAAYFLGFLWGDGDLWAFKDWNSFRVGCNQSMKDFEHVIKIFEKNCNDWKICYFYINGKKYGRIYKSNTELYDFFKNLGYKNKSVSHRRALDIIDDNFKHFFVLGLLDSDGCVGYYERKHNYQVSFAGPYHQQWGSLVNLFKSSGIETRVDRRIDCRGNRVSYLLIKNLKSMAMGFDFIYQDAPSDLFFQRKFDKYEMLYKNIHARYEDLDYIKIKDQRSFPFPEFKALKYVYKKIKKAKENYIGGVR